MQLIAERISHQYTNGVAPVLTEVTMTVDSPGPSIALVGPSGSGKTTLLSILGGLLRPTSGSVHLEGRPEPVLQVVSWVHQSAHALRRRNVLDNVVIGSLARGSSRHEGEAVASEMLALVGLGHRAGARAGTLSGGELQRLGIARALAKGDPFLFADEPTGQLDADTSGRVLDALFAGSDIGVTIVVATHDPMVASRCTHVIEVKNGTLHRRPAA